MDSYFDSLLQTSRNKMKLLFSWNHWWESCETELSFFVHSSSCPLYGMKSHVKQFMGECFRHSDHFSLEWLPTNQTRQKNEKNQTKMIPNTSIWRSHISRFILIDLTHFNLCLKNHFSRNGWDHNRMIYQIRSTQTEYCDRSKNSFLWTFNTSLKALNCWEWA